LGLAGTIHVFVLKSIAKLNFRQLKLVLTKKIGSQPEYQIDIDKLQKTIRYLFKKTELLIRAVSHRSNFSQSQSQIAHSNERLEFLGDAVLDIIVTEFLYRTFPDENEGTLSQKKSILVSRKVLGKICDDLGLGAFLILNKGEEKTGGRKRLNNLANLFEALLGAIYLDGGMKAAEKFVYYFLLSKQKTVLATEVFFNYKSMLLEFAQSKSWGAPKYKTVKESGPDHHKEFVVSVEVKQDVFGSGSGFSKKSAEQKAAKAALLKLSGEFSEIKNLLNEDV